jgi:peptidoglycan/LPS O-acetylase OafA/YrhL
MQSQSIDYFPKLDHLRFYAALLVILAHSFAVPRAFGNSGVSLFMVLSGFILTIIVQAGNKPLSYNRFIFKRFIRIFPLFTVVFFIMLSLGRTRFQAHDLLSLLLLQSNLSPSGTGFGHDIVPISGPTWTIAVEFQFYLIFPFLILFLHQNGVKYLLGLIFLFLLFRALTSFGINPNYWDYYHTLFGRIDQFIVGMLAAWLYVYKKSLFGSRLNFAILIVSVIGLVGLYNKNLAHHPIYSLTLEAVCYAGIIWGYFLSDIICLPSFLDKTLALFGRISYSTYLLHVMILAAIDNSVVQRLHLFSDPFFNKLMLFFLFTLPIILFVSYVSYTLIEKPFLYFGRKYT